jgi:hypothetical protein
MSTSIASNSNAGGGPAASSTVAAKASAAAASGTVWGRVGSGGHDDLKFSNPGGAISSCEHGSDDDLKFSNPGGAISSGKHGSDDDLKLSDPGGAISSAEHGSDDDLKFSNPGGAISFCKHGSDCNTGEGGPNSGCCSSPSVPSVGKTVVGKILRTVSDSMFVTSKAGNGLDTSSMGASTALVTTTSGKTSVVSTGGGVVGSGNHDDLKFSNPGGGVLGELGSACVMEAGFSTSRASDEGTDSTASSGITNKTLGAAATGKEGIDSPSGVGGGNGNHDTLQFSDPAGAISGELVSVPIVGENGLCIDSCSMFIVGEDGLCIDS